MASVPKLPENKRSSSKLLKGPQEGTVRTDCCFFFFFLSSAFPQAQLGTGTHFLLEWCEDEYPGYRGTERYTLGPVTAGNWRRASRKPEVWSLLPRKTVAVFFIDFCLFPKCI